MPYNETTTPVRAPVEGLRELVRGRGLVELGCQRPAALLQGRVDTGRETDENTPAGQPNLQLSRLPASPAKISGTPSKGVSGTRPTTPSRIPPPPSSQPGSGWGLVAASPPRARVRRSLLRPEAPRPEPAESTNAPTPPAGTGELDDAPTEADSAAPDGAEVARRTAAAVAPDPALSLSTLLHDVAPAALVTSAEGDARLRHQLAAALQGQRELASDASRERALAAKAFRQAVAVEAAAASEREEAAGRVAAAEEAATRRVVAAEEAAARRVAAAEETAARRVAAADAAAAEARGLARARAVGLDALRREMREKVEAAVSSEAALREELEHSRGELAVARAAARGAATLREAEAAAGRASQLEAQRRSGEERAHLTARLVETRATVEELAGRLDWGSHGSRGHEAVVGDGGRAGVADAGGLAVPDRGGGMGGRSSRSPSANDGWGVRTPPAGGSWDARSLASVERWERPHDHPVGPLGSPAGGAESARRAAAAENRCRTLQLALEAADRAARDAIVGRRTLEIANDLALGELDDVVRRAAASEARATSAEARAAAAEARAAGAEAAAAAASEALARSVTGSTGILLGKVGEDAVAGIGGSDEGGVRTGSASPQVAGTAVPAARRPGAWRRRAAIAALLVGAVAATAVRDSPSTSRARGGDAKGHGGRGRREAAVPRLSVP